MKPEPLEIHWVSYEGSRCAHTCCLRVTAAGSWFGGGTARPPMSTRGVLVIAGSSPCATALAPRVILDHFFHMQSIHKCQIGSHIIMATCFVPHHCLSPDLLRQLLTHLPGFSLVSLWSLFSQHPAITFKCGVRPSESSQNPLQDLALVKPWLLYPHVYCSSVQNSKDTELTRGVRPLMTGQRTYGVYAHCEIPLSHATE